MMKRWTVSPVSTEDSPLALKSDQITEIHHDIKIPHGIQTPYKLVGNGINGDWARICR